MAAIEKDVSYCFFCGNEVTKGRKKITCTTCRLSHKFSLPVEITPEELEMQYKDVMDYCYNCGEELFKDDEVIMCADGCGLIDITLNEVASKECNSQALEMTSGSTKSLTPQVKLIQYSSDYDDKEQDDNIDKESSDSNENSSLSELIVATLKGSREHWSLPDIHVQDCKRRINFYVIVDKSIVTSDQFGVSIISKEIDDGKTLFGNFKCIYEKESFQMYHSKLPIPNEFLWIKERKVAFRYAYAIVRKKKTSAIELLSEDNWRVVGVASDSEYVQFDPVIIPQGSQSRVKFWKRHSLEAVCNDALPLYLDWACNEQQWMTICTDNVLEEAKEKGQHLNSIINSLRHYVKCVHKTDALYSLAFDKLLLNKIAAIMRSLSGLERFQAGFILIEVLIPNSLLSNKECLAEDMTSTLEIVRSFYIPTADFEKCVSMVKSFDSQYKTQQLFPVITSLCNVTMEKSHNEWMGLLPLLHVIKHDSLVSKKPFILPNVERDILPTLFCGLDIPNFLSNFSPNNRFVFDAFNLVKPYFQDDWLMSRAFLAVCPFRELLTYVQYCPESSPFACWLLGMKHVPKLKLDDNDCNQLTAVITGLFHLLHNIVYIEKEETTLCYNGANKIVHVVAACTSQNTSAVFKASLELCLLIISKTVITAQTDELIKELSEQLVSWMQNMHDSESLQLMNELQDWNDMFALKVHENLSHIWNEKINSKLSIRLDKVQLQAKVDIFKSSLAKQLCQEIVNALIKSIMQSLQNIVPIKDEKRFQQLEDKSLHQEQSNRERQPEVLHWVVNREEIMMTQEVIGKGGYGEVKVAVFRGLRVAAKCLHDVILSPYILQIFTREMEIAARVRHPNLLQFIGATREGIAIILTELMPTSLYKELEISSLTHTQIVKISRDIALALNYLHLWKPYPILHRDVSSPNVLLEPCGTDQWKAKLSDYGSANIIKNISSTSTYPGNPRYAAPEAQFPDHHSPAMDVYSFGVLLMEMISCELPLSTSSEREHRIETIQWQSMKPLVQKCIVHDYQNRLTSAQIVTALEALL